MNHHRQITLLRCAEVAIEIGPLQVDGREIPMAIQARLAQGHNPRTVQQGQHAVPVAGLGIGRGVGMDADGGEDLAMRLGQRDDRMAGIGRHAHANDRLHARGPRRSMTACRSGVESCWSRWAWVSMKGIFGSWQLLRPTTFRPPQAAPLSHLYCRLPTPYCLLNCSSVSRCPRALPRISSASAACGGRWPGLHAAADSSQVAALVFDQPLDKIVDCQVVHAGELIRKGAGAGMPAQIDDRCGHAMRELALIAGNGGDGRGSFSSPRWTQGRASARYIGSER